MIDQVTIDRIMDAANIVDVVSEFVTLRKRGVNYVGLCPFHDDKSPSFYVSPSKNICKCFACGEGGTAVHFIMKHEQLNYFDALRFLAKKYNIEIHERELTDQEMQAKSDRESMFIVNEWAQNYFTHQMFETEEGRTIGLRYFAERGFHEETIRKFKLGYSLDQREGLFKEALRKGYRKEYLEKTGLIIAYDNGNVNDRFRGRVIFPVLTLSGKVVAFGGRVLKKDAKTAKYVNSPESQIYHKSNELYGMYFAKQAIVKANRVYLVEGYTDVISMHQAGVENVVASSGTALTQGQIRMIHRFTENVTVLYDGDAAGIKAALRGIDLLLEDGLNIKVLLLPDGEDPDSFARKHNATEFIDYIQQHETDFVRFKTQLLLQEAGDDPIKRAELISDIIRTVAIIPNNISRSLYIRECSEMMSVDEQLLITEINKIRLNKKAPRNYTQAAPQTQGATASTPPSYVDIPGYQPMPEEMLADDPSANVSLPENIPPPVPEEEEIVSIPFTTIENQQIRQQRSPYEPFELVLLKYIVRYGERILFNYIDDETQQEVTYFVASYIRLELERDDLSFYTPLFRGMLNEAAERCGTEGFIASKFFLTHPDPNVSKLAADLLSEKYQLSKYHTKYREIEQEEDKLDQLIIRELYAFKDAYILQQIKEIQEQIKTAQQNRDMDKIIELMKRQTRLNEIKNVLSKELGERIVLKM